MKLSGHSYKNDNPNLGIATIFCNINKLSDSSRKIIDDSKTRLHNILREYGFEVRIYDNLRHSQITNILTEVSLEDHSQNDCFLAAFIGDEDDLFNSDFHCHDDFFHPFSKSLCTLKNKPKLFFIDLCKNNEVNSDTIFTDATPFTNNNIFENTESYIIPKSGDLFIHFSNSKDYKTWFSDEIGSLLIGNLSDMLEKFLKEIKDNTRKNFDIYELATAVNRCVAFSYKSDRNQVESNGLKMMPIYTSSLTKLFTINPKPKLTSKAIDKII